MTKITGLGPDVEFASASHKQLDADNQRAAWLRQLEQSQFALLQQDGQLSSAPRAMRSSESAGKTRDDTAHASRSPTPASVTVAAVAKPIQLAPVVGPSMHATPAAASGPDAASAVRSAATPATAVGASGAPTGPDASGPKGHTTVTAGLVPVLNPAALQQVVTEQSTAAVALAGTALHASPTADAMAAGETVEEPVANTRAAITARTVALPQANATEQNAGVAVEADPEVQDARHSDSGDANRATPNADWQKRMMHIAQSEQGASVAIRDNGLDARSTAQLVYRLASDFFTSGLHLTRVTVNGRVAFRAIISGRPRDNHSSKRASTVIESMPTATLVQEQQYGA